MHMIRQVAFALRQLARAPGFTAAAVLCLGLGTGANVAVFSIANAVMSRPLPLERSEEIFLASRLLEGVGTPLNFTEFSELREAANDLDLAIRTYVPVNFGDGREAQMAQSELVSANYFNVLRPRLVMGRPFAAADDQPSNVVPVIISRSFWLRRFNEDPTVLGRQVRINARLATIIAVAPEGFTGVMSIVGPDLWIPLGMRQTLLPASDATPLFGLVGRVRPGHTISGAQAQLETLLPNLPAFLHAGKRTQVEARQAAGVGIPPGIRGPAINGLSFLAGLALLVLAIAVSNVVSLMLIRAALRAREYGIRAALGAGSRLIRDALIESLILSILGVMVGGILAWWTTSLITSPQPAEYLTSALNVRPDLNALWFAALVAIFTGLAAGIIPALRAGATDPLRLIRRVGTGRQCSRGFKLLSGFVITQIALSSILAFGAGLLLQSYLRRSQVELGFQTTNVLAASFNLADVHYDETRGRLFYDRLAQEIRAVPGVDEVALASETPFTASRTVTVESPALVSSVKVTIVSPQYFDTLGIAITAGRRFDSSTGILINETLARQIRPGARLRISQGGGTFEVAGVVKDTMIDGNTQTAAPVIYRSYRDEYRPAMIVLIRTSGSLSAAAALRRAVSTLDPDVAIMDLRTLASHWERTTGPRKQIASLFSLLAALALLITAIGIYGVIGFTAKSRQHEFAVRTALGGWPRLIAWQIFRSALALTFWGLMIGVPLALALVKILRSSLFGATVLEPAVILGVALVAVATAIAATSRAARAAVRTDIAQLLRQD
jgi:putative ABC transport system permease protein